MKLEKKIDDFGEIFTGLESDNKNMCCPECGIILDFHHFGKSTDFWKGNCLCGARFKIRKTK